MGKGTIPKLQKGVKIFLSPVHLKKKKNFFPSIAKQSVQIPFI